MAEGAVADITLFSFALRIFLMKLKWSSRLLPFVSFRFVLPPISWTPPSAAASVFAPLFSKRISRNFPSALPEETRVLRVLCHLSS